MKALFVHLVAAATTLGVVQGQGFLCDIPTHGCTNGMFNQALCECHCIPPFCADANGDCTSPSQNCGEVKWKDCTRGVNCPWWVNTLRAESCTTGPDVPVGIWDIYSTRSACCNKNFAYSEMCDIQLESADQPTKHPTIAAAEDDLYEIIPIKFDVMGLPDGISNRELKDEMKTVLKRIVLRLSERIPGLKVTRVEEKAVYHRHLQRTLRALEKNVSLYFHVFVLRDDDRKFGPLIISEMRDSYQEVLTQIQTFSDTTVFGGDLSLNLCTSRSGKFDLCAREIVNDPPRPARAPVAAWPRPVVIQSDSGNEDEILPGWAIALIVIFVLLLLACLVGFVFFCFCKDDRNDADEIRNNIYMGDEKSWTGDEKSWASARASHRSPKSTRSRPRSAKVADDDSSTVETGSTIRALVAQWQAPASNAAASKRGQGRDPTVLIPGQEDKPDPDSRVLMITDGKSGRRHYRDDHPRKSKRDPTMYAEGKRSRDPSVYASRDPPRKSKRDPSMYVEGRRDPSMYVEGQKDPSMYVDGQQDPSMYVDGQQDPSMYVEGQQDPSMYVGGRQDPSVYDDGRGDEKTDDEFDRFGFKKESVYSELTSKKGYSRDRREPSYRDARNGFKYGSRRNSSKCSLERSDSSYVEYWDSDLHASLPTFTGNLRASMSSDIGKKRARERQVKSFY